jgi:hypothetical protein
MNIAEKIAEKLDWDGQNFEDGNEIHLFELCKIESPQVWDHMNRTTSSQRLYVFSDDSYIVVNDQFWDVLYVKDSSRLFDSGGNFYVEIDEDGEPLWDQREN